MPLVRHRLERRRCERRRCPRRPRPRPRPRHRWPSFWPFFCPGSAQPFSVCVTRLTWGRGAVPSQQIQNLTRCGTLPPALRRERR
eukprot:4077202-Prymnesium_polylepis.1